MTNQRWQQHHSKCPRAKFLETLLQNQQNCSKKNVQLPYFKKYYFKSKQSFENFVQTPSTNNNKSNIFMNFFIDFLGYLW